MEDPYENVVVDGDDDTIEGEYFYNYPVKCFGEQNKINGYHINGDDGELLVL